MSRLLPSKLIHHSGPLRPFALTLHALDTEVRRLWSLWQAAAPTPVEQ